MNLILKIKEHAVIGGIVVFLSALHVLFFFLAVSVRSGSLSWSIFIPDFGSGYYKSVVSLGMVAFLFMLLVGFSGVLRLKNRRMIVYKFLHGLGYLSYFFMFVHGFLIGSDVGFSVFSFFYVLVAVFVFWVVLGLLVRSYRVNGFN